MAVVKRAGGWLPRPELCCRARYNHKVGGYWHDTPPKTLRDGPAEAAFRLVEKLGRAAAAPPPRGVRRAPRVV